MARLTISLKQPWAALLVSGRKSIEVRRWTTGFRGELLIHAARVDDERSEAWAHVDDQIRALASLHGGIIGVGNLAEVRIYRDRAGFVRDRLEHLNEEAWFEPRGLYGFRFEELQVVPYCRVPGFFRLFEVEVDVPVEQASRLLEPAAGETPARREAPAHDSRFHRLLRTRKRAGTQEG